MYPFSNCYTGALNIQSGGAFDQKQIKSIVIALILVFIAIYLINKFTNDTTPGSCTLKTRPKKNNN